MSEHEPIEDKQAVIERAAKLRTMTQSPGWQEIFVPELLKGIAEQKEVLAATTFPNLLEVRLNQERIRWAQEIIDGVKRTLAEADDIVLQEAVREAGKEQ